MVVGGCYHCVACCSGNKVQTDQFEERHTALYVYLISMVASLDHRVQLNVGELLRPVTGGFTPISLYFRVHDNPAASCKRIIQLTPQLPPPGIPYYILIRHEATLQ